MSRCDFEGHTAARETRMDTTHIYDNTLTENVKIRDYKFRRLSHANEFWTAWNTGKLEGKTHTKVIYKLTSAMRWARFTKPEILQMLRSWYRKHNHRCDLAQLQLIYASVENWLKPKMRERKRLEMQRYRERRRQRNVLEAFKAQVVGGGHE